MEEVEKGNVRRMLTRIGNFGGGGDVNVGRVVLSLSSSWDERKESAQQIAARLRPKLQDLAGVRVVVGRRAGSAFAASGRRCRSCSAAATTKSSRAGATSFSRRRRRIPG